MATAANPLTQKKPRDIRSILDPLKVSDDFKAQAWDEFHAAKSPEDFKARFDRVQLPDDVKADLWDVKFTGQPERKAAPMKTSKPGLLSTVAREGTLGLASGVGLPETEHESDFSIAPGLKRIFTNPIDSAKLIGSGIWEGHKEQARKAADAVEGDDPLGFFTHGIASLIPVIGPASVEAGTEIGEGIATRDPQKMAHGTGRGVGTLLSLGLGTKGGQAATSQAVSTVGGGVRQAAEATGRGLVRGGQAVRHPVKAGRALVDTAARTMSRRTAEQNLMGAAQPSVAQKRAPQNASVAGQEMQRVRTAKNIEIRGEEALPKAAQLARETKNAIWAEEMTPRLKAAGNWEPDMKPVADAIRGKVTRKMRETNPKMAEQLENEAKFYEGKHTLEEIEAYIEEGNQELKGFYRSPDPKMTAGTQAKMAEIESLRKVFNETLNRATSPDVKSIKRRWGATREYQLALDRQVIVQARQKGMPLYEALGLLGAGADILDAVATFNGFPLKAAGMRFAGNVLSRMRDANFQLEEAFHGKNAFKASKSNVYTPPARKALPAARSIQVQDADLTWTRTPPTPAEEAGMRVIQGRFDEPLTEAFERGERAVPGKGDAGPGWPSQADIDASEMMARAKSLYERAGKSPDRFNQQRLREQAKTLENRAKRLLDAEQAEAVDQPKTSMRADVERPQPTISTNIPQGYEPLSSRAMAMEEQPAAGGGTTTWAQRSSVLRSVARDSDEARAAAKAGRGSLDELPKVNLRETYDALDDVTRTEVDQWVEIYKSADFYGKGSFNEAYGLDRGDWKGLPIQEKFARALKKDPNVPF